MSSGMLVDSRIIANALIDRLGKLAVVPTKISFSASSKPKCPKPRLRELQRQFRSLQSGKQRGGTAEETTKGSPCTIPNCAMAWSLCVLEDCIREAGFPKSQIDTEDLTVFV